MVIGLRVTLTRLLRKQTVDTVRACYSVYLPSPHNRRDRNASNKRRSSSTGSRAREIDQLGAWDSSKLNFQISEEQSIRRGIPIPTLTKDQVGVCCAQGRRRYQEDSYTLSTIRPNVLLLAVWDGHGGDFCSKFCAEHITSFFNHRLDLGERDSNDDENKPDLEETLKLTLLDLDEAFARHWLDKNSYNADEQQPTPGSTATVAVIRDGYELVIGHIGDSAAILCRGHEPRRLTNEHCPTVPEERERIEEAGGELIPDSKDTIRVNGRLNMSRSIGDLDLKPYGVTCHPDIHKLNFKHRKDKFLALMSDGVTVSLSDKEIVDCIMGCEDPSTSASRLVDMAFMYASEDNATALVLPLGSWGTRQKKTHLFSLGRNISFTSSRYS